MSRPPDTTAMSRCPQGPWRDTWILAATLVILTLIGTEIRLRMQGYRPSVTDDLALWSRARDRAQGERAVAIIGSSRIQSAIDPLVLANSMDRPVPAQLAMFGCSPLPVLEDLSGDESFRGLVICEVTPHLLFESGSHEKRAWMQVQRAARMRQSPGQAVERWLWLGLSGRLVFPDTDRELRRPPEPGESRGQVSITPERMYRVIGDRELLAPEPLSEGPAPPIEEAPGGDCQRICQRIRPLVADLEERGGRVVFLTLPERPARRRVTNLRYPRERFWDVLLERTGATGIHHEDHAQLASFQCVDATHIDGRDAPAFTRALADLIRRTER